MIKAKMLTRTKDAPTSKPRLRMRAYTKQTFILESTKYNRRSPFSPNLIVRRIIEAFPPWSILSRVLVFHPGEKSRRGALDEVVSREVVGWKRAGTVAALAGPKIGFYRVFGSGNSRGRWVHVGCKSPFRAFKNAIGGPI